MTKIGIKNDQLQSDIVVELIDRFNTVLAELAHEFGGNVWHVDCTDTVKRDRSGRIRVQSGALS